MPSDVKFIRVRGRVVPVKQGGKRVSTQSKETLERRKDALKRSPNKGRSYAEGAIKGGLLGAAVGAIAGRGFGMSIPVAAALTVIGGHSLGSKFSEKGKRHSQQTAYVKRSLAAKKKK